MKLATQAIHRMSFGHRKVDELLEAGIFERGEGPTPWVSPIVMVLKDDGDIRLSADM